MIITFDLSVIVPMIFSVTTIACIIGTVLQARSGGSEREVTLKGALRNILLNSLIGLALISYEGEIGFLTTWWMIQVIFIGLRDIDNAGTTVRYTWKTGSMMCAFYVALTIGTWYHYVAR